MTEYICREVAYADFERCNSENQKWTPSRVKTLIARQPPADVVPVVRCRECKHYKQDASFRKSCFNDLWNQEFAVPTEPDDFCSYGERNGGDDNG